MNIDKAFKSKFSRFQQFNDNKIVVSTEDVSANYLLQQTSKTYNEILISNSGKF